MVLYSHTCFFFFQAEDGIRDSSVTGVQTCALPISSRISRAAILAQVFIWSIARARAERSPLVAAARSWARMAARLMRDGRVTGSLERQLVLLTVVGGDALHHDLAPDQRLQALEARALGRFAAAGEVWGDRPDHPT